jgi:hypothetical protein
MNLDCNTPNGRIYINHAYDVMDRVAQKFRAKAVFTDDDGIADIDALFTRDNKLVAIAEIKSRNLTKEQLEKFGSYLITQDKIERGIALSVALQVPYFVMVKLITSDMIAMWKITDHHGMVECKSYCEVTTTKATCNGGEANRLNAFLSIENCIYI